MGVFPCFELGPMGGALGIPAVARVEKTSGEVTVSILQEIEEGKW